MHLFTEYVNPHLGRLLEAINMDKRFVRGEGCYLYDADGRRYLDFVAAYGALPFGFNPPEIWAALHEVEASMEPSFVQPSALQAAGELAERLVSIAPAGLRYVTFANSGAEAVEAAIKAVRAATGRMGIISCENSFHGKTLGALSATHRRTYQDAFGAPVPGFAKVPYGDLEALERLLAQHPEAFAGFIVEPVQGEGGIVEPPPGYLRAAQELCRRYGVFFILLSYLFMYRYVTQEEDTPFKKTLAPLALSGLFFGFGCASKWIVVYAGLGLFALYLIAQVRRIVYYRKNDLPGLGGYIVKTLLFSFIFYILIPAAIYCLSYIPYAYAYGLRLKDGMLWNKDFYRMVWDNQLYMFRYHSQLKDTHPYQSSWYQWIVDGRPILYFSKLYNGGAVKSAFAAFGNPALWWGGFAAIIAMAVHAVRRKDGKALFILIGYLSQLLPWVIIPRIVFIYHYFPSTLFLALAMAYVFNTIFERGYGRCRRIVYGYTAATVFLFVMFYPVLSGEPVPTFYTTYFLCWFPGAWPFY